MPSRWRRVKPGGESGAAIKATAYKSRRGGRQEAISSPHSRDGGGTKGGLREQGPPAARLPY